MEGFTYWFMLMFILAGSNLELIENIKGKLTSEFEIIDKGDVK